MLILIIVLSIVLSLIIIYFILAYITTMKMIKRGKEIPLVDLDLSKTQYAKYENMVRESNLYFKDKKYEEVYIKSNDKLKLKAYYYPNKLNTLIICFHGYRATPLNNFALMGKLLYEKGYSLLMIVERAHGDSEGKYITFGDKEKFDVINWVNFAKDNLNPDKIFLYGLSMGASSILLATKLKYDPLVKGLIVDSAFKSTKSAVKNGIRRGLKIFGLMLYPCVLLYLYFLGFKLKNDRIYEVLKNNEIPVLFIHGMSDNLIPINDAIINYDNNKGKKELIKTDAMHVLSMYTDYELISNKILEFIKNN